MVSKSWRKLACKSTELQLKGTLNGGQSFRWKKSVDSEFPNREKWTGVFRKRVWQLVQEDEFILYKVYEAEAEAESAAEPDTKRPKTESEDDDDDGEELRRYFRLDLNLEEHYRKWSEADPHFKRAADEFYGVRILAQEVTENLFSFICSSNNNIGRISGMVEKMCSLYGEKICEVDGVMHHAFPEAEALARPDAEKSLRQAGFGYRAGYVSKSARTIAETGSERWFRELESLEYPEAKKRLTSLSGVGAKVADCVCLMSLGHLQSVPVDTHVYQIAARYYLKHLGKQKTVTERVYNEIGDHFRKLYGPLAGWAHTVLFCADLKSFKSEVAAAAVKGST